MCARNATPTGPGAHKKRTFLHAVVFKFSWRLCFGNSRIRGIDRSPDRPSRSGIVKANEYSRFSALNSAERGGNSRAKTVELQPALVREQAV